MTTTTPDTELRDRNLHEIARAASLTPFPRLVEGTHPQHLLIDFEQRVPHFANLGRRGHRVELLEVRVWGGGILAALAYCIHSNVGAITCEVAIVDCRGTIHLPVESFARGGDAIESMPGVIARIAPCPTAALLTMLDDEIIERERTLSHLYGAQQRAKRLAEAEARDTQNVQAAFPGDWGPFAHGVPIPPGRTS